MPAPGASCGQMGDSLDRVCEDPPPVSDPGPRGTLGGGRQGRAGQARPSRTKEAHSRGPIVAQEPIPGPRSGPGSLMPEMLTLAGAGGSAPEATASNGRDRPTTAQSSSLGGHRPAAGWGSSGPHSGLAASPAHSGGKRRGPEPAPCAGPPPGPSWSEPLDRRSSPLTAGSRWASPSLTRHVSSWVLRPTKSEYLVVIWNLCFNEFHGVILILNHAGFS